MDSGSPTVANQAINDVEVLFTIDSLDPTVSHTITLTNNLEGAELILDYLVYDAAVGGTR